MYGPTCVFWGCEIKRALDRIRVVQIIDGNKTECIYNTEGGDPNPFYDGVAASGPFQYKDLRIFRVPRLHRARINSNG